MGNSVGVQLIFKKFHLLLYICLFSNSKIFITFFYKNENKQQNILKEVCLKMALTPCMISFTAIKLYHEIGFLLPSKLCFRCFWWVMTAEKRKEIKNLVAWFSNSNSGQFINKMVFQSLLEQNVHSTDSRHMTLTNDFDYLSFLRLPKLYLCVHVCQQWCEFVLFIHITHTYGERTQLPRHIPFCEQLECSKSERE